MKLPPRGLVPLLTAADHPHAFLLAGPDVVRVLDAAELVRRHYVAQGLTQRELVFIERGHDWEDWFSRQSNGSLFGDERLRELRLLETPGLNEAVARGLLRLAEPRGPVLVTVFSLEKSFRTNRFYRHWEESPAAAVIELWPLRPEEWPAYVGRALRNLPRPLEPEALARLARATEGNVQALRDTLERMRLLLPPDPRPLGVTELLNLLDEEPRLGAFDYVDALVAGDLPNALHRLRVLERLGTDPLLVVGALAHRLREDLRGSRRRPSSAPALPLGRAQTLLRALAKTEQALKRGRGLPPWLALEDLTRTFLGSSGSRA